MFRRLAWASDIHLEFCDDSALDGFVDAVVSSETEALLLGGDIGTAQNFDAYLTRLADELTIPIYFVLGNHDYYSGSFAEVGQRACAVDARRPSLHYLTAADEPIALSKGVCIVGCGDWADARLGDFWSSPVALNDFRLIQDFAGQTRAERLVALHALGDAAAARLDARLDIALTQFETVIVLLHVPPFASSAWHAGKPSGDDFLPFFSCKAVGDVLLTHFERSPRQRGLVLCGHTHGAGEYRPLNNLLVLTAGAHYGKPAIARVLDLSRLGDVVSA